MTGVDEVLYSPIRHLYARKGENITCENNHLICTTAHDIFMGERYTSALVNWTQPEPKDDPSEFQRCRACGALWWALGRFHFENDGWR